MGASIKKNRIWFELNKCVVSKTQKDLVYVSPKSGCAVSKTVAKGYEKNYYHYQVF